MADPALVTLLKVLLVGLAFGIAGLLGSMVAARASRLIRHARERRFARHWEPLLYERMEPNAAPLPPLKRSQRMLFLTLWERLFGYVDGEARSELIDAAREAGMESFALELLAMPAVWKRLCALSALSALRSAATRPDIEREIDRDEQTLLAALKALIQVDPRAGLQRLLALLPENNWPASVVAALLKPVRVQAVPGLQAALADPRPGVALRLIRIVEALEEPALAEALRTRLMQTRDPFEKAAALHALGRCGADPDRRAALSQLGHRNWLVRMQAAFAVGQLGLEADAQALLPLLGDRQWWVRYRAAQALHGLLRNQPERFEELGQGHEDRYGREVVQRVLQEARGMA